MKTKTYLLLIAISIFLNGSCSKDRERESLEEATAKTTVSFEINSFEETAPGTLVVKSAITFFATQQEITHYGLYYGETQDFGYDANIFHEKTYKPNGKTITIEYTDTIKNLKPENEYFFKLVAWVQPQLEGRDYRKYSSVFKYNTQKNPLQITGISPKSGTYRDEITIKGRGFSKNLNRNKVTFNGIEAVINNAYSDSIKVVVPKKSGTGDIMVTLGNESANAGQFEYVHEPYVVYTLAGSTSEGYADGIGKNARFFVPVGMVLDKYSNLFVADRGNNRIRKMTPDGLVSTIAGTGKFDYLNGTGATAQFRVPNDITLTQNPYGNILVTQFEHIRIISSDASQVKTFVGSFENVGYADGWGTEAKFNWSNSLVSTKNDIYYVSDFHNNCIRKIDGFGQVTTFAQVPYPTSMTIDSVNNLFVISGSNFENIYKITPNGEVSFYAGNSSGLNLKNMAGITVDSEGNLFVTTNFCIKKIAKDKQISIFAGKENLNNQFADRGISNALFGNLKRIIIDNNGNFYVTDLNCIRKIEKID